MTEEADPFDKAKSLLDNAIETKKKEEIDRISPILLEVIKSKGDKGIIQMFLKDEPGLKGIRSDEITRSLVHLTTKGIVIKEMIKIIKDGKSIITRILRVK